jgi:hypothetical protein
MDQETGNLRQKHVHAFALLLSITYHIFIKCIQYLLQTGNMVEVKHH